MASLQAAVTYNGTVSVRNTQYRSCLHFRSCCYCVTQGGFSVYQGVLGVLCSGYRTSEWKEERAPKGGGKRWGGSEGEREREKESSIALLASYFISWHATLQNLFVSLFWCPVGWVPICSLIVLYYLRFLDRIFFCIVFPSPRISFQHCSKTRSLSLHFQELPKKTSPFWKTIYDQPNPMYSDILETMLSPLSLSVFSVL